MIESPLDYLASAYGNVVRYDATGNAAGIFVKFPKMKSSELVSGLPAFSHPAFIINGAEQDYILLGKYPCGTDSEASPKLISAPNIEPAYWMYASDMYLAIRRAGSGISGMTIADYGFIKLLAQKMGWTNRGNNYYGVSSLDGIAWNMNTNYAVGVYRYYRGWKYKCLQAHTSSVAYRPDMAPAYWEKLNFVGGMTNGKIELEDRQTSYHTLNGTGPKEWYLGNDLASMADLVGNVGEMQYGYRLVNNEIQIMQNNDAADPSAYIIGDSAAWKAIMPNAINESYTLVEPGTEGTLHWNWTGSAIQLDTQCDDTSNERRETFFKDITAHPTRLPYVPVIMKLLGLFPTDANDTTPGMVSIIMTDSDQAHYAWRGGSYLNYGTNAYGLGHLFHVGLWSRGMVYGARSRALAE